MNKEQLTEQLKGIEQEIKHRLDIRSKIRQQFADLACPYIVGEKIQRKQTNERAIVATIRWSTFSEGYKMGINKIKKDGKPYKNITEAWDLEKWSKCEDPKTCSDCCAVYSATLDQCTECGGTECD